MKRSKNTDNLYIVGVVYKYTSPSGKSYIGQTTNERQRINTWFCTKYRYAGATINRARAKYGPENFTYEVLFKKVFTSLEEAREALDREEEYYINVYDTLKSGYNNTTGGIVPVYGIRSKIKGRVVERKVGELTKSQIKRFSPKRTRNEITEARKITNRTNGRWRKVNQFTVDGIYLNTFSSASEAEELGFGSSCNIRRACKTRGTYKGYSWRYAEEGYTMSIKEETRRGKDFYKYLWKGVSQYTKDGNLIRKYANITEAMHYIGVKYNSAISACLRGRQKSAHGFVWKYTN